MIRRFLYAAALAASILLCSLLARPVIGDEPPTGIGATFTYQGDLLADGLPVDSFCDFEISLWDAAVGGTQIGTLNELTLDVTDGIFTANLDFGPDAFSEEARWLEISVTHQNRTFRVGRGIRPDSTSAESARAISSMLADPLASSLADVPSS